MPKTFILYIIYLLAWFVFVGIVAIIFDWGVSKQERLECEQWKNEALEFAPKGYYISDWQFDQCQHYGIKIEAIVK